jgi:predicted Ser/Thr protein kinase
VEVPLDAPEGLCPNCVLKVGLQTGGGSQTGATSAGGGSAAESFVPPTPAELAAHFPELEILELVGRGGMGVVYKARQKRLDRLVALKILSPKVAGDPAFAERFAREARAMAMLSHSHIVAVYDFGQTSASRALLQRGTEGEGPLYYFLMEFVDGLNLRQLLDSGKLAPREALAIVPQICEALQFAHDHGIVHRDIKPENILLGKSGQVKIADFGLAKLMGRQTPDLTLTSAGQVMGTPHYMAPEQTERPQEVDHRADIYSLGVVFYQMLTGELPLGRFAPPSKKVQIDVRLDEVVLRALEKDPELRYQQASQVKTDVESIVAAPRPADALGAARASAAPRKKRRGRLPMVGVRGGERVVHWPGVALRVAMIVAAVPLVLAVVACLACLLGGPRAVESLVRQRPHELLPLGLCTLLPMFVPLAVKFLLDWNKPFEELLPLEELRTATPAPPAASGWDAVGDARREVRGPAIGLLVTGILNWLMLSFAALLVVPVALAHRGHPPNFGLLALVIAAFACSTVMIVAALKMKRLQAYGLAVAASVLAMVVSPCNLVGLPIGIWALVVLGQREVRAGFRRPRAGGSGVVSPPDDIRQHDAPFPSTGGASGTPRTAGGLADGSSHASEEIARWPWNKVPWQIWAVVVLLAIEGVGDLMVLPTEPRAIEWLLAKCLFVVGLVRGWKWVFFPFQLIAAIHVLFFMTFAPFVALENLVLIGLAGSAYRFYFPRAVKASAKVQGVAWKPIAGNVILGLLVTALLTLSPAMLLESVWRSPGFGGQPSMEREQAKPVLTDEQVVDVAANAVGPWIARLPDGIAVELVGVGENKKENNGRWWRPDGSPLADRAYKTLGGFVFPLGENTLTREFAVRLGNLPAEPVGTRWQFEPPGGSSAGGDTPQTGPGNIRAIAKSLPGTARTVNVRFGVAAGPWQTVAEGPDDVAYGLPKGVGVVFAKPYEKEGGLVFVVSHTITDREVRAIAVDKDGHEHRSSATRERGVAHMSQITATFPGLAGKIRAFRLQARPYQWVEFRNVALNLGQPAKADDMQEYLNQTQQLVRDGHYPGAPGRLSPMRGRPTGGPAAGR